jgi:hypothetical protein
MLEVAFRSDIAVFDIGQIFRSDLDDRFHETGAHGTGRVLVDSSFEIG